MHRLKCNDISEEASLQGRKEEKEKRKKNSRKGNLIRLLQKSNALLNSVMNHGFKIARLLL